MDSNFVGRQHELLLLGAQYVEAASGRMRFVLLSGEPGVGKTSLISEFATQTALEGAIILQGGASEAEGMPPYLPFLEALGAYIKTAPADVLQEQAGYLAPILGTILPELVLRIPKVSQEYFLPGEQARMRLFQAVSDFITAIAAQSPVILVLEDLHWADSATLDLLSYIAGHSRSAPLLILGSYRPGDAEQNTALGRAMLEWNRLRVLLTVPLSPLSPNEIAALASGYLGNSLDTMAASLLNTHSEGNPFFAEELLRGWLEDSALYQVGGQWTLSRSLSGAIPDTIIAAVRQRLSHLPAAVQEDLSTASIIGRSFDTRFLSEVLGFDPEEVEARLMIACNSGLLRMTGPGVFSFSHDKIRECLYNGLSAFRVRRLHGFIGRSIEILPVRDAQRLADLAFHFALSGDHERGATYSRQAAEHALRAYAPAAATAHYRMALSLMDPADRDRSNLLFGLGEACLLCDAERDAVAAYTEALDLFIKASDTQKAAASAHGIGKAWSRLEQPFEARESLQQALFLLGESPSAETIGVLVDLGSLLAVSMGKQTEGIALAERAYNMACTLAQPRLEAAAGRTLGNLLVRSNHISDGEPLLRHALALAVDAGDLSEAAECCACLSMAFYWSGRLSSMQQTVTEWARYALQSNDPYQSRHVYAWQVGVKAFQGNITEALSMLPRAYAAVENLASAEPLAFLQTGHSSMLHRLGRHEAAGALIDEAISTLRGMSSAALTWYLGLQAISYWYRGMARESAALVPEIEKYLDSTPQSTTLELEILAQLSQLAILTRDLERAHLYYARLLPYAGCLTDIIIDRVLGEMAFLLGDLLSAQLHLDMAEDLARREGVRPELAFVLLAKVNLVFPYYKKSGSVEAETYLLEAISIMQDVGMEAEEQLAQQKLAALHFQDRVVQPVLPAGLTEREVEVLRLVVQGFSNRRIAEQLSLSEKTVANHLTNIYSKTNTDNRAGATAFALRQGLA